MVCQDWSPSQMWKYSFLFWLMGLSSWISITGLFAELSLISYAVSEGFEIWSYITLLIQLANIGPYIRPLIMQSRNKRINVLVIYSFIPRHIKTQDFVIHCGYFIFILGTLSMLGLSLCWNQQTVLFGQARSIALYVLTFCSALTDCLTSIIFWVFVSYAPTPYMAALSAGESSSGIISSILIWIQQSGRPRDSPRYSITAYLMIISCLIPISAVAFFVLVRSLRNGYLEETTDWISRPSPSGTRRGSDFEDCAFHSEHEQLQHEDTTSGSLSQRWTTSLNKNQSILSIPDPETEMVQSNLCAASSKMKQYCSMGDTNGVHAHSMVINEDTLPHSNMTLTTNPLDVMHADHHRGANSSTSCSAPSSSSGITRDINNAVLNNVASGYWGFMMAMGVLSGVQNGMLPSILSFALLPYGNDAYIWSVTISNVCNPLCAALPAVFSTHLVQRQFIWISAVGWIITAVYILTVSLKSPYPFGVSQNGEAQAFWEFVTVTLSVMCALCLTLCKTSIYLLIKKTFLSRGSFLEEQTLEKGLSRLMEIIGIAVQLGSFCGAVLFFLLVNMTGTFQQ